MNKNWEMKKLGEVCEVIAGQSPEGKYYNKTGNGLPFYQGKKEFTDKYIGEPTTWTTSITKEAQQGDILMSVRAPVGPVNFSTEKICIGRGLAAIRPSEFIDKEYLFNFLLKHENEIVGNAGAVFNSINKTQIQDILIPLPSLPEQQHIVFVLDETFAAIDKAKENVEKNLQNSRKLFDSYLQGIFAALWDGGTQLPLSSVANVINGYSFKSGDFSNNNEVKSVKITNVGVKKFVEDSQNNLPAEYRLRFKNYLAYEGDIVIALTRTIISDGLKVAIVPPSYHLSLINQRVAAIRVDNQKVISQFLYMYFCADRVANYVLKSVNTLMQPNLSIKDLLSLPIPLPPLSEQQSIVAKLDALSSETKRLEAIYQQKLAALDELKKSVLQKAFNGELTGA